MQRIRNDGDLAYQATVSTAQRPLLLPDTNDIV